MDPPAAGRVIVALTILAFAFVYSKLGIRSADTGEVTRDFVTCAYFSVVTFTTLGFAAHRRRWTSASPTAKPLSR